MPPYRVSAWTARVVPLLAGVAWCVVGLVMVAAALDAAASAPRLVPGYPAAVPAQTTPAAAAARRGLHPDWRACSILTTDGVHRSLSPSGDGGAITIAVLDPNAVMGPPAGPPMPQTSHLSPQNGDTLWDWVGARSLQDRRAFLLGIAIQIHAPATATNPDPNRVYPSKEG